MFETIELFGQKVDIKNSNCTKCNEEPIRTSMKLNLYIKVTDVCNARCEVCSNKGNEKASIIDLEKLKMVISYLDSKDIINRIGITGGEPMLDIKRLNDVLNAIYEVKPSAVVTINTNGCNIKEALYLDSINKIEGIHISRHHYQDEINNKFFGINTATNQDIEMVMNKVSNKKLLRLNCLLMKKYINNIKEVSKYLDNATLLNIFRVGFVSLMPINNPSIENFINFKEVFKDMPSNFIETNNLNDLDVCQCTNGLYLGYNGNIIEYYARMTKELNCEYARQLVYTSDNKLTVGFNKKPLI